MVNSLNVPGWKLNVENGRWNQPGYGCKNQEDGGWYGWTNSGDGSISTTLNAIGQTSPVKGKLKFANCYENGQVVAYLDGNEIAKANAHQKKNVEFYFKHGSTLELREVDQGIIHFLEFKEPDCIQGKCHMYFKFQYKLYFNICLLYTDCGSWWFELDRDTCWMFNTQNVEHDVAKEICEKKYYGKLLELDENVPDTLKNVYVSDTIPAWVTNKVCVIQIPIIPHMFNN